MKRSLAIILAIVLVLSLAACSVNINTGSSAESTQAVEEPVSGGWTVYTDTASTTMPEALLPAFLSVTNSVEDVTYSAVAYLGSQVVAGTNYQVLCTAAPKNGGDATLKVLIIYIDLDGKAELTKVSDFNITDYTESAGKVTEKNLAGGWQVNDDIEPTPLPDDAQKAFDKAVEGFDGNKLTPMALLGTQVVSGTNYAILCGSELVTEEPVTNLQVVTVYADLEGKAEITNICTLDLADFNQ